LARNLGDNYCDDKANNEACEFDKSDCCLSNFESKEYCKECLCKEKKQSKAKDSKYTGEKRSEIKPPLQKLIPPASATSQTL
jgi:hypothetical protein